MMKDNVEAALDDIALTRAIDEGIRSESVPRQDVFASCFEENTGNEPAEQPEA